MGGGGGVGGRMAGCRERPARRTHKNVTARSPSGDRVWRNKPSTPSSAAQPVVREGRAVHAPRCDRVTRTHHAPHPTLPAPHCSTPCLMTRGSHGSNVLLRGGGGRGVGAMTGTRHRRSGASPTASRFETFRTLLHARRPRESRHHATSQYVPKVR